MPPRPSVDRDSTVPYEPLRASVLDVFEQLGAFDDDSGIVDLIFPELQEQKENRRTRVKLTEVFDPEPEPETPRKQPRTSRFFRLGTRSRSKSRTKKESKETPVPPPVPAPAKESKKLKKSTSSPNLRKEAVEGKEQKEDIPPTPPISSPVKHSATTPENKSRRRSLFPRKAPATSLDQPRPSISDEDWQQITITGSIADYDVNNPFLGKDPNGNPIQDVGVQRLFHPASITHSSRNLVQASPAKRDGPQKYFSRFTHGFARSTSTPTSPTREHGPSPLSAQSVPISPSPEKTATPTASTAGHTPEQSSSATVSPPASDPTTPTGPYPSQPSPFVPAPASPVGSSHSNASTSTLPAVPRSADSDKQQLPSESPDVPQEAEGAQTDDRLETTSQIDHVRKSLSDISEGEHSESSTLSMSDRRDSQVSASPPEDAE
ncbi:hypothetical protein R3P38DRAFT_3194717 [Favolaschia claudopus]|uniref:Uncharacterized protein n=1 Tax=Favolaschia claudopus TaxID=2862362 RepID=A0AAW0BD45_9AGAR